MRRLTTLSLITLLTLIALPALAQKSGYARAAYLESWNGGTSGGPGVGAALETVMVDIFIGQMRGSYDHLSFCKGIECTENKLLDDLQRLTDGYEAVDLFLATHGSKTSISVQGDNTLWGSITKDELRDRKKGWHRRHRLRTVMGMNCYGNYMADAWLDLGFDVVVGAKELDVAGFAYTPLFLKYWKKRNCLLGGGDCSRSVREAIDRAWSRTGWIDPLYKFVTALTGGDASEVDSRPIVSGMSSLRVVEYEGVYNACNNKGDAFGFLTETDKCCLPGERCDDETFNCEGPDTLPAEIVNAANCTPAPAKLPAQACRTGADCPSGNCLVTAAGWQCATACTKDNQCGLGERCAVTNTPAGELAGSFCAPKMTQAEKACTCKGLLDSGCGMQTPFTFASGGPDPFVSEQVTTLNDSYQRDDSLLIATAEQINWMAVCGCPVSADSAGAMCGFSGAPNVSRGGGCNVSGGTGGLEVGLLALALLVLVRRRRR